MREPVMRIFVGTLGTWCGIAIGGHPWWGLLGLAVGVVWLLSTLKILDRYVEVDDSRRAQWHRIRGLKKQIQELESLLPPTRKRREQQHLRIVHRANLLGLPPRAPLPDLQPQSCFQKGKSSPDNAA